MISPMNWIYKSIIICWDLFFLLRLDVRWKVKASWNKKILLTGLSQKCSLISPSGLKEQLCFWKISKIAHNHYLIV